MSTLIKKKVVIAKKKILEQEENNESELPTYPNLFTESLIEKPKSIKPKPKSTMSLKSIKGTKNVNKTSIKPKISIISIPDDSESEAEESIIIESRPVTQNPIITKVNHATPTSAGAATLTPTSATLTEGAVGTNIVCSPTEGAMLTPTEGAVGTNDVCSPIDENINETTMVETPDEPIKKKRGRKPKPKSPEEVNVIKIPKKRGRKPKIKLIANHITSNTVSQDDIKKKGRKPKIKTYSLVKQADISDTTTSNVFESDSYIVTLKINSTELKEILETHSLSTIEKEMMKPVQVPEANVANEPKITQDNYLKQSTKLETNHPYVDYHYTDSNSYLNTSPTSTISNELTFYLEKHFNYMYSSHSQISINYSKIVMPRVKPEDASFNFDNTVSKSVPTVSSTTNLTGLTKVDMTSHVSGQWISRKVTDLLPAFKNKSNTWPSNSPYACWNCDNFFDSSPIGIPDHIEGDVCSMDINQMKFYVYGNFCSTNCAARWLFEHEPASTRHEQYSLLNVLHTLIYGLKTLTKVRLAPKKIFLEKFGGYLTIERYRNASNTERTYQIFKPPMIPILYQMEESMDGCNASQNQQNKNYIPVDYDNINRVEQKLKVKRLAPVRGNTLTIDKCMNIKLTS